MADNDSFDDEFRWCDVGSADEWADGAGRLVQIGKRQIGVYRLGTDWFACKDICPHAGVSLVSGATAAGSLSGPTVTCPAHGWAFDLRSGQHLGDSIRGQCKVATYPVQLHEGRVFVGV